MNDAEIILKKYNYENKSIDPINTMKRRAIVTELKYKGYNSREIEYYLGVPYLYSYFSKDPIADKFPVSILNEHLKVSDLEFLYKIYSICNILLDVLQEYETTLISKYNDSF